VVVWEPGHVIPVEGRVELKIIVIFLATGAKAPAILLLNRHCENQNNLFNKNLFSIFFQAPRLSFRY